MFLERLGVNTLWAPTPTMDVIFYSVTTHVRLQIWFPQRVLRRASDVRNAPARLAVSSRINLMVSFTRTDVGKCCSFLFPWIEDAHIMLRLSCLACAVASPSAVIRMRYNLGARAAAYPPIQCAGCRRCSYAAANRLGAICSKSQMKPKSACGQVPRERDEVAGLCVSGIQSERGDFKGDPSAHNCAIGRHRQIRQHARESVMHSRGPHAHQTAIPQFTDPCVSFASPRRWQPGTI